MRMPNEVSKISNHEIPTEQLGENKTLGLIRKGTETNPVGEGGKATPGVGARLADTKEAPRGRSAMYN